MPSATLTIRSRSFLRYFASLESIIPDCYRLCQKSPENKACAAIATSYHIWEEETGEGAPLMLPGLFSTHAQNKQRHVRLDVGGLVYLPNEAKLGIIVC